MYLRRKIDSYLEDWKKDSGHKPLVIRGSRQVGKTESIREFASKHYESVVEINFIIEPKYRNIIADGYDAESIIRNITFIDPAKRIIPGKTLIFFDEIQDFPEIATSFKSFASCGKVDMIASGSLLGINYKRIESVSVGYKTDYEMFSMDFEEFLWANGYGSDDTEDMLHHMLSIEPFSALKADRYHQLFLYFSILGGMPAVVASYIEKGSFDGSLQIQRQLLYDYREDITKYAEGLDQGRILNVFDHIPAQLAKDNKKFQISKVERNAKFKDYRGCIEWLANAGIINVCYALNFPELPLKGNYDDTKYKLYMADTGLLVAMLDDEAQDDLRANKNLGVYKGALYENIAAEALRKSGCGLYYYKRENSTLEEDFFIRSQNSLIPVEVKASNGYSKSLRTLIESDHYPDIRYGIKLTGGNIGYANGIYTFPYFCTFLLRRYIQNRSYDDIREPHLKVFED